MTLIDNYKQSAYNDIEKAKQGIVARVDKRKSLQLILSERLSLFILVKK
jgi:hypothetical protein